MTRFEQVARLIPYVRDLADRMCLKDWRIQVLEETVDTKDHNATIETIAGYKSSRIRLAEDFFEMDPEERRSILCHELVHLHVSQLDDFLRPILGQSQQTTYDLLRELAVDEMAHAIEAHMPLPPSDTPAAKATRRRKK